MKHTIILFAVISLIWSASKIIEHNRRERTENAKLAMFPQAVDHLVSELQERGQMTEDDALTCAGWLRGTDTIESDPIIRNLALLDSIINENQ